MHGRRWLQSLLFAAAGLGIAGAQTSAPAAPNPAALVRLSFVQGEVSILQGETTQFGQAQANMPLFAGNTVSTGESGQAEIEFIDGSVARLTPNSQLRLDSLPAPNANGGVTDLEQLGGMAYYELNTADGQRYTVHFNSAVAQPTQDSIFRITLDGNPELAVVAGTVHTASSGAFDESLEQGHSLQFEADNPSNVTVAASIRSDSWDQWNQDRDDLIAQQAQQQTAARETSGAAAEPGWDDLDYYGDWYPTEEYGNVWVPSNTPAGWDPYGSGYWANYAGYGPTWISSYPWGWLPYHCGAWNYWNSFGWGWVPGQCGLGWQPYGTVWNAPAGFRVPPHPIPGGHAGRPVVISGGGGGLVAVNRGPALATGGLYTNTHTQPIRISGQRLDPLPVVQNANRAGFRGLPATTGRSNGFAGGSQPSGTQVLRPGIATRATYGGPASVQPPAVAPRPVFRPYPLGSGSPRAVAPSAPRMSPSPRMSAPQQSAPRMSAPAPMSAPRMSAPSGGRPH